MMAITIYVSALAIASLHGEAPAVTDAPFMAIDVVDFPAEPPAPPQVDVPIDSPPTPSFPTDFFDPPQPSPRNAKPRPVSPIRSQGPASLVSRGNFKTYAVSAPRPEYPYEARSRHVTGSGVALVTVDPASGCVIDASMEQSIGSPILDDATVSAFRRWRFKPGTVRRVRIPITFALGGASF